MAATGVFLWAAARKVKKMSDDWNTRTKLVHGGTARSQYNEVSEAIFLT